MDETMKNTTVEELEGKMHFYEENAPQDEQEIDEASTSMPESNDELKAAIEAQLTKIRRQSMLIGAQTSCSVILEKIIVAMGQPGKRSMNDYRRLIKDIEHFCNVGISRKINADGEAEIVNENDADQNNTKLMEDADESNPNESN